MLKAIWDTSLILAASSLAIMIILILRRLVVSRTAREAAEERRALLKSLIAFSDDHDREKIKERLALARPQVALDACFEFLGLLRGGEHDDVVSVLREAQLGKHLLQQLRRGNEADKIHATEMLAVIRPPDAAGALMTALKRDRSREVRIAAAIALADMGAFPPLVKVLHHIGVDGQRSRRIVEMFRHIPADRLGELRSYLGRQDASPLVRAAAIESLSQTSDPEFIRMLESAARDQAPEVAAAAIRAVARISVPDPAPVMAHALMRGDWQVRHDAANAIGKLGLVEFVDALSSMLDDEAWMSRYAAGKALRKLGPKGVSKLKKVAAGKSSRSQRAASLVLAEEPAR